MATTIDEISTRALQHLRVIGTHAYTTSDRTEDLAFCFKAANLMLDHWAAEHLVAYYMARTTKALTASQTSYTIGESGQIDIPRPVAADDIIAATILNADGYETPPIRVISREEYAAIPQKAQTAAFPDRLYFDGNWASGLARIWPFPIPDNSSYTLVLYTRQPLEQFAAQDDEYTFPPGYERAIELNLALEIEEAFDAALSDRFRRRALEALESIIRRNSPPAPMQLDAAVLPHRTGYNIRTDSFR